MTIVSGLTDRRYPLQEGITREKSCCRTCHRCGSYQCEPVTGPSWASTGRWPHFSSIASGFFGQIEENSTFTYSDTGIVPLHYIYRRSVLGQERENELTYNQKDKVLSGSRGSKNFTVPLAGGELDMGTYILALRDDVARGMKEPCYNVIDDNKVESPRYTRFWFAPSLDYSIAKLEHQEQKGKNAYSLEITYYKRETVK